MVNQNGGDSVRVSGLVGANRVRNIERRVVWRPKFRTKIYITFMRRVTVPRRCPNIKVCSKFRRPKNRSATILGSQWAWREQYVNRNKCLEKTSFALKKALLEQPSTQVGCLLNVMMNWNILTAFAMRYRQGSKEPSTPHHQAWKTTRCCRTPVLSSVLISWIRCP